MLSNEFQSTEGYFMEKGILTNKETTWEGLTCSGKDG